MVVDLKSIFMSRKTMPLFPKVCVIRNLQEAIEAVIHEPESLLISTPEQTAMCGVGYFKKIFNCLRSQYPSASFMFGIHCGDHRDLVLIAINYRFPLIIFDDQSPVWDKVASMAQQAGICLFSSRIFVDVL